MQHKQGEETRGCISNRCSTNMERRHLMHIIEVVLMRYLVYAVSQITLSDNSITVRSHAAALLSHVW
jgi:hypothetical protein